jgi:hypothetical protein
MADDVVYDLGAIEAAAHTTMALVTGAREAEWLRDEAIAAQAAHAPRTPEGGHAENPQSAESAALGAPTGQGLGGARAGVKVIHAEREATTIC